MDNILRQKAEEQLFKRPIDPATLTPEQAREQLHELQVHQIELEMQNDELRRTQLDLEESRTRYFDLYDMAPVGYFTVNQGGLVLETNLTAANMLGMDRSGLITQPLSHYIFREDQDLFYLRRNTLIKSGTPQAFELRMIKGATPFWVSLQATVAFAQDGQTVCRITISDISVRKQLETTQTFLVQCGYPGSSGDFFQLLAQYLAQNLEMDYVCIDRLSGDKLHAETVAIFNDGKFDTNVLYALKDTPCGAVMGKIICSFPEKVCHLFPNDKALLDLRAEGYMGATLWGFNGNPIGLIALISRKPLVNPALSEVILKLVSMRAAGELERREAEEKIKQNDLRLVSLLNLTQHRAVTIYELLDFALSEAITLTASKIGYVHSYNEETKECTLISQSKEVMKECSIADQQTVYQLDKTGIWGEAVRQRRAIIINNFQAPNPLKQGMPFDNSPLHRLLTIPVFIEDTIVGVVGVANKENEYDSTDATQLTLLMDAAWRIANNKQAEEALRSLNVSLEHRARELSYANHDLKAFSYSVSHDLRNPLNAILTNIEILAMENRNAMGADSKTAMGYIVQSANRMVEVINNLLTLSGLSRKKIERKPVDLSNLVQTFLGVLQSANPERNIEAVIQPGVMVNADAGLMQILIENLVRNAWKYSSHVMLSRIEFGEEVKNGEKTYFIRDNGAGFDMKDVDRLFKPFERLHSQQEFRGLGLGLALAERIISKHNGTIWATGEKDKGATIYFKFET
ncbi:MAG: hypothetical protein A2268_15630 [Candidatus Raymondbacteria bacterium RifOxyA12_full_50_37]|uniref:histidine kinase n=1 Tax=Candidatus Raymondbacteria bacterium RIFOXYD12_FULL_49_13 TaxID=1817890 RepID=A0A1F7FLE5_UNCRA|nr:MAG: hypothetical protein A2268_15630 [Candidatus Raymondbacteria bacterium RifOxyA12_full_50_37]OGJ86122.1 MAG: hypothetical protein A2248_22230 [Candidatus Raymondbacteria bacterium RIFOXYA2_FULL_49_16]OGJ95998.1 MAG: hypothetical protein A2453_05180 [Candidatus Raymondbacteria bacterium RIFOXYC2_FULL_50_21]OGJ96113.1 MAG: hypothetical protein A2350_01770 [Candidatus Raymondbacteria bacterium RifOxyB12_full_50_8]OGK07411.1 MAG: hypothetical protein A2519_02965 [Candidatus Raymondbacteria b